MSNEFKANPMLKMFLPTAVKMLQNPAFKTKLLSLINEKKAKINVGNGLDVRIDLFTVSDELIAKVVIFNVTTNQIVDVYAIYTFEELVGMLSKIV